jgi:hypothetical protein
MKNICILSCLLLVGALDSAKASVLEKSTSRTGLIPFSADAFATSNDQEDSYSSSLIGASEDDFSVDKAKKKKKKKKSHAS